MRRVVVTGMGAITPIGLNVEDFWNSVKAGKHGFGEVTHFDTTEYKVHLAAEVKGFQGKDYMDRSSPLPENVWPSPQNVSHRLHCVLRPQSHRAEPSPSFPASAFGQFHVSNLPWYR